MYLQRDGCRFYYEIHGSGEKTLVFLHGNMMSSAVWHKQVREFSSTHRILCCDLRGCGRSDKPEMEYTTHTFVGDLKYLLEMLNVRNPILIGWSIGGFVALAFAAVFPGIARKLVLVATTPCLVQRADWAPAVPPEAARQLQNLLTDDYAAGISAVCDLIFTESGVDAEQRMVREIMLQTPLHVALSVLKNLSGDDLRPRLPGIKMPVTIICGEQDMLCPLGASEFLARELKADGLHLIAGAGHAAFLTRPKEFNAVLGEAIARDFGLS